MHTPSSITPDETISVYVFLDFEFYTEKRFRREDHDFDYNPYHPGNLFLGGVIKRVWPDKTEDKPFQSWIWEEDYDESKVIRNIYDYLRDTNDQAKQRYGEAANVILCGFGVSSMDIPVLYTKCLEHDIPAGKKEELFETLICSKKFEMGCIMPAFFNKTEIPYLYARSLNVAKQRFMSRELNFQLKEKGSVVFDHYDSKSYRLIMERTKKEVEDCQFIHNSMVSYINIGVKNYQSRANKPRRD